MDSDALAVDGLELEPDALAVVGLKLEPDMHLMHGHTHTSDGGITWKCKTV